MPIEKLLGEVVEKLEVLNNQVNNLSSSEIQQFKVYERIVKLMGIENELRAVIKLEKEAGIK